MATETNLDTETQSQKVARSDGRKIRMKGAVLWRSCQPGKQKLPGKHPQRGYEEGVPGGTSHFPVLGSMKKPETAEDPLPPSDWGGVSLENVPEVHQLETETARTAV